MTLTRLFGVAIVLWLGFAGGLVAQQQKWYEHYDRAIQHVDDKEYEAAERELLAAKGTGTKPARSVLRYGMLRTPFVPDYYLGIVYLNLGRPKEALSAFEAARPFIRRDDKGVDLKSLDENVTLAQRRVQEPLVAANQPSSPPPSPAIGQNGSTGTPAPTSAPTVDRDAERRQRFQTLISEAEALLGQELFREAAAKALEAQSLSVDSGRANTLLSRVGSAEAVKTAKVAAASDEAAKITGVTDALSRGDAANAQSALAILDRQYPSNGQIPGLRAQVQTLLDIQSIAQAERAAMRAFFGKQYQQSIGVLQTFQRRRPLSPRGYFYLACSQAALALLEARVDQDKLAEARRIYARGGAAAASLADRKYMSPKILNELSPAASPAGR